MSYRFEITKDKEGKFRFHLEAPNGKIMLQSQAYTEKHSAKDTIESIKENAGKAEIIDKTV